MKQLTCNIINYHKKDQVKITMIRVLKQMLSLEIDYPVEQQFPPIDNDTRIGNIQNNPNDIVLFMFNV